MYNFLHSVYKNELIAKDRKTWKPSFGLRQWPCDHLMDVHEAERVQAPLGGRAPFPANKVLIVLHTLLLGFKHNLNDALVPKMNTWCWQ